MNGQKRMFALTKAVKPEFFVKAGSGGKEIKFLFQVNKEIQNQYNV